MQIQFSEVADAIIDELNEAKQSYADGQESGMSLSEQVELFEMSLEELQNSINQQFESGNQHIWF